MSETGASWVSGTGASAVAGVSVARFSGMFVVSLLTSSSRIKLGIAFLSLCQISRFLEANVAKDIT